MKLLMWDIDGTLIRGNGSGRKAMNRAFARLFGEEDVFSRMYLAGSLDLNTIETIFAAYDIPQTRVDDYLAVYYEELRAVLAEGHSELLPYVKETLAEIARRDDMFNALGTGNVEPAARIKLDKFDLGGYFPVGGYSERPMERHEMIALGIAKARAHYQVDFALDDVVVIGDTGRDVEAGKGYGVRVISVTTGDGTYAELDRLNPGRVLVDLRETDRFFSLI